MNDRDLADRLWDGECVRVTEAGDLARLLAAFPDKLVYVAVLPSIQWPDSQHPVVFLDKDDIIITPCEMADEARQLAEQKLI